METRKYVSLNKLSVFLDNLKSVFANITHTHTKSEITDLVIDTELSSTSENLVQNKVVGLALESIVEQTNAEFDSINDKIDSIEIPSLDGYATEEYVENLYKKLNSNTVLGFYCI